MWGLIFPGQGSQHPGMGKFLFDNFAEAKTTFEEASDTLHVDMMNLLFNGSEEDLKLTKNTQPALLLTSIAGFRVLQNISNMTPVAASGHSVGEYAALVSAGVMSFPDALRAVRLRGEAMQDCVPMGVGAMCAVMGLTDEQVRKVCQWVEAETEITPLEPANFNCPGQVVVSGRHDAITWLQNNFKKEALNPPPARAKFIPLKVSAPFHCSMMLPAQKRMEKVLSEMKFQDATITVVQNVDSLPETNAERLRQKVIQQISAPVLWTQCIQTMVKLGCKRLIECGSGTVLSGLVKKIDPENLVTFNMNSLDDLKCIESELAK